MKLSWMQHGTRVAGHGTIAEESHSYPTDLTTVPSSTPQGHQPPGWQPLDHTARGRGSGNGIPYLNHQSNLTTSSILRNTPLARGTHSDRLQEGDALKLKEFLHVDV